MSKGKQRGTKEGLMSFGEVKTFLILFKKPIILILGVVGEGCRMVVSK